MSASLPPLPKPQESTGEPVLLELGSAEDEPCLRADAARNRARLLEAATRLIEEHGAAGVTMEAVAVAASVGKGTVFRRFGDRTGLLTALLDHSAKQLQAAFLSGPPPLGPGAPPVDRLRAFGLAVLRQAADHLELQLAAQPEAARRYSIPPTRFLSGHVTLLLRQAVPDADCALLAQALMGYLDPALIHHLTKECGMPMERLEAGWTDLVARVTRTELPQ
ncbi:TetR/AcrR family transcriptional regulator [Streptomyces phaeochromogenes]|uniref:TetR/AcrR family transcriptional regulator n=1 Tax=Streptomyces phaeochromogenes TaxID=1923 RepID=A0ABZ1H3G6_STRPH|nr:TetR/AcrR family transcriptional regulator [Streptomyces phaeochromogenes]MCX5603078.1 TetR/AcrR family transcriptional regulator [Streptomyces phaeochromogenes]WRZ27496.1 TetR/AcrR family transcriptional regulator [Streptomyces phaeochromogenes]WSD13057.1 TetR/AcrR family transcriptional regulator [Streptomyces phaeochromogenes]WSJ10148.1 TetR/AcrR family transcriptional regulator [Streptomyces phaeochromogenes]WSW19479.1 TetR/AcrR family transcriptional regulator [Streptomyces phaeochromo